MGHLAQSLLAIASVAGLVAGATSIGAHGQNPAMPHGEKPHTHGEKPPTHGQKPHMHHGASRPEPATRFRVTMEELHAHGGVPRGWKFAVPSGDPAEGRKVFVSLECFACHEVKGETFPADSQTPRGAGPELTSMGSHHPAEYFAESILDPNRVIVVGPGYTGDDGLSKMPTYSDTMTLEQLVDVVAYLKSLTGGDHHPMGGMNKEDKR